MTKLDDVYLLPQDEREVKRLAVQTTILARTIPNWPSLIPDAALELQPGDKVLDSGAGTASWLREMYANTPNSSQLEFYGIDISSSKFPSSKTLPSNIKLSVNSVQSLPEEWSNSFAFVHQTFLIVALRREEWLTAVNEIQRVLKPGAWVAFGEPGRFGGGPKTRLLEDVLIAFYTHMGVERFHVEQLPHLLASPNSGFDPSSVHTTVYQLLTCPKRPDIAADTEKRKLAQDGLEVYTATFRHLREVMFEKAQTVVEKYCKTISDFDKLMDDVQEEWENTTESAYLEFVVVAARKT